MDSMMFFRSLAGNSGEGARIAMLDTGIDAGHPAFRHAQVVAEDICGRAPGIDTDGHGTQCCGIIVQAAPAATLLAGRIVVENGSFSSDALFSGLMWAARQGANIICVCTGERVHDPDIEELIDRFAMDGRTLVAAVGNRGRGEGLYPARCRQALAIGSADEHGEVTDFTELPSGKQVVCLAGIRFTVPVPGGGYTEAIGTSMSAALAAGILALKFAQTLQSEKRSIQQMVSESCIQKQTPRGEYLLLDAGKLLSRVS